MAENVKCAKLREITTKFCLLDWLAQIRYVDMPSWDISAANLVEFEYKISKLHRCENHTY